MTSSLGLGVIAITVAVVLFAYVMLQPELVNLRSEQMKAEEKKLADGEAQETHILDAISNFLGRLGWKGFSEDQLSQAGIKVGSNSMVAIMLLVAAGTFLVFEVLTRSLFFSMLLAVASTFGVSFYVKSRTAKRKAKFNRQMGEAMTLLSSALKSGMNVPTAMANTAAEMDEPMGEELARIVNESRLGRDMVSAMFETAERMESDDFKWITEAVAIQRESGGRLSEILDRVTHTIAERNELQQKVASLAAEGKASGYILMALPIVIGLLFAVINTEFIAPLVTTGAGRILLVFAAALYAVGGFWLNQITKVKL